MGLGNRRYWKAYDFLIFKMLLNQYKFLGKCIFLYEKSEDYSNFYLITFFQMRAIKKTPLNQDTRHHQHDKYSFMYQKDFPLQ